MSAATHVAGTACRARLTARPREGAGRGLGAAVPVDVSATLSDKIFVRCPHSYVQVFKKETRKYFLTRIIISIIFVNGI